MSRQKDSLTRFDKIMHALLAVPNEEALRTVKRTIAEKEKALTAAKSGKIAGRGE